MAVAIKSPDQIRAIAQLGRALDEVLRHACLLAQPGTRTRDLARELGALARARGVTPMLLGYTRSGAPHHAFPADACINVNEEVTHAVPSARLLREGDVITIDCAVRADDGEGAAHALCIDAATTHVVTAHAGDLRRHGRGTRMAHAARAALDAAIDCCHPGTHWSTVAARVQSAARDCGVCILPDFRGHGVGAALHEPPTLSFGHDAASSELVLRPGMVLCLEPVVCEASTAPACITLDDGWTVVTHDRSWSAFEEACIAITRDAPRVLAGAAWRSNRG